MSDGRTALRLALFLGLIGACGIVFVSPASAGVSGGDTLAQAETNGAPVGIQGDVTTDPVPAGDRVLVGTSRGLFVLADGHVERRIDVGPVRDVTVLGDGTALVLVADQTFPNVKKVDLASGTVQWRTARERRVYDPTYGHTRRPMRPFDGVSLGDVTGDGTEDVAVAAGEGVVGLDGANGERLWNLTRKGGVWELTVVDGQLYAGTRHGAVLGIDPATGDVGFETQVADPFRHDRTGRVPRSVWNVRPVDVGGTTRLAVSAEDGTVALLSTDGSIQWEQSVVEFGVEQLSKYYRRGSVGTVPTLPGDQQFRNVRIVSTAAEANGGPGLVVAVMPQSRVRGRRVQGMPTSLHLLDARSGEVAWTNTGTSLGRVQSVAYSSAVGGGSVLVPRRPRGGTQTIDAVTVGGGSDSISAPYFRAARGGGRRGAHTITVADGRIYLSSDVNDVFSLHANGSVDWWVPRLRGTELVEADFTGDGTDDTLVVSRTMAQGELNSRTLQVLSGTDGSVVWSRTVSLDEYRSTGGFGHVRAVERTGGADVVAIRRPVPAERDRRNRSPATLVVLSGRDGSTTLSRRMVGGPEHALADEDRHIRPRSTSVIGDVTGDGDADVLIGARQRAFVVDLQTGDVVWERIYPELANRRRGSASSSVWSWPESRSHHFTAIDGGSTPADLLAVSRESSTVTTLSGSGSGDDLTYTATATSSFSGRLRGAARRLGDVSGDGTPEYLLRHRGDGEEWIVYDPVEATVVTRLDQPDRRSVTPLDRPVGDVDSGFLSFTDAGDAPTLTLYASGGQRWTHSFDNARVVRNAAGRSKIQPAAAVGDVDGDGRGELAVVKNNRSGWAWIDVYDVGRDTVDRTIVLSTGRDESVATSPGLFAQSVPDQTGDGTPELAVTAVTDGFDGTTQFFVVDPAAGTVLVRGQGVSKTVLGFDDGIGLLSGEGALTTVDPSAGVSLSTSVDGSTVTASWTNDVAGDHVAWLLVDDRPVERTTGDTATVALPPGEHTVQVRSQDRNGISRFDARTVDVGGGSIANVGLFAMAALSLGALFVPWGLRRRRR